MKIIIATNNPDKLREIKNIWKNFAEITDIDWLGNYSELGDIEETGSTLRANAAIKAEYVSGILDCPAVADDTGLFVDCLNGSPGVYSSRFAGENATYDDNVEKLLKSMENVPEDDRRAEFRCTVCLAEKGKKSIFTEGIVKGSITLERKGSMGFGYDPVFKTAGTGKTFAQMTLEEKNAISHRYLAFKKMGEIISRGVAQLG
ncbi:RdgB/HAM1 family non-canonical purine NTP pyrophosphatase [Elusimicrobiota bacterium]